jgi:type I restriction enzyme, R subunit
MPNYISEDQIEKTIIEEVFDKKLGYRILNCFTADVNSLDDKSNRTDKREVVFLDILKNKAYELNKDTPRLVIDKALDKLVALRTSMSPTLANQEVYNLIKDGVPERYENKQGKQENCLIKIIDFKNIDANDFLAVRQLWIKGDKYPRRPDVILYINGLPLVFIELKNSNIKIKNAYDDNLTNYKSDIPLLFQYNAFCILSNALDSKVGSFTADWEHFFNWFRVDDEKEKVNKEEIKHSGTSLERVVLGLCEKKRLLDYIENFVLYHNNKTKIVAQNHQFIGVNKALESFESRKEKQGKLGVFWHTQGSGKSFSMIFLARKIFRKLSNKFTFVIITDREDLDKQIYKNFLNTETVSEKEAAQPKNSEQMRDYLSKNKRLIFTLIHKFRWDKGKEYPLISDRDDIVVIVDEAHRTQYKSLAENMRKGLPNAQYFAFTGTPLLGKERKTNAWFGDYISEYNFDQAIDDGATVRLFYEKRVPEVLIHNEDLSEDFYQILEEEGLDENHQEKLEKEFSKELEIIKRDDRLDKIARDIAYHFPRRGYLGKGMVISIDKFTSVKMYDKVQYYWKEEIKKLTGQLGKAPNEIAKKKIKNMIEYMRNLEMSVVVSEEAGEVEKFEKQGLDIKPHRKRMNEIDEHGHDIEYRFKDPKDPLQLVFVCAMWLTGFDAPTVSTLYLDKPMKNHTLMQTIARANRVTSYTINNVSKANGEIIDYYNVFRNMKRALADYGVGSDDSPEQAAVEDKSKLYELLDDSIKQGCEYLLSLSIDLTLVLDRKEVFKNISLFEEFANKLLEKDEFKKQFCVYENTISGLYEACKPEIVGDYSRPLIFAFQYLRGIVDSIIDRLDIDTTKQRISELLDQSVIANSEEGLGKEFKPEYQIIQKGKTWDLSKINFTKLKEEFKEVKYKNIEITDLRLFIEDKLQKMMHDNATRTDFAEKLQAIIDCYNSGGSSTENYFEDLLKFTEDLKQEDERAVKEGLTEDELELFDILRKEKMTKSEEQKIKLAAKSLLHRLIEEHPKVMIQDWYKDTQTQIKVKSAIEDVLDKSLPDSYNKDEFQVVCQKAFDLVYRYAIQHQKWAA